MSERNLEKSERRIIYAERKKIISELTFTFRAERKFLLAVISFPLAVIFREVGDIFCENAKKSREL